MDNSGGYFVGGFLFGLVFTAIVSYFIAQNFFDYGICHVRCQSTDVSIVKTKCFCKEGQNLVPPKIAEVTK
jgi:hypothetical protein